jgi:predicted dithiol-disulfide oxidoreductase (DUF899 family)
MVRIDKQYVFEGGDGRASLSELFRGRPRLVVYHFPFDPRWDGDCGSCSHLAEGLAGAISHRPARDTSFAAISSAPIARIESCRSRMGWTFPWLSSAGNTFSEDFGELPGLTVFLHEGDAVFQTGTTYRRDLDALLGSSAPAAFAPRGLLRHPPRRAQR